MNHVPHTTLLSGLQQICGSALRGLAIPHGTVNDVSHVSQSILYRLANEDVTLDNLCGRAPYRCCCRPTTDTCTHIHLTGKVQHLDHTAADEAASTRDKDSLTRHQTTLRQVSTHDIGACSRDA
jgi:hypothetical protein